MNPPPAGRPRGRRPAGGDTRQVIVEAARELFASRGYAAVSLRAIARSAEVDPALVHHYFEGKSALFAAAVESPVDPAARLRAALDAGPVDDLGRRIVRTALDAWDPPEARARLAVLLRHATEQPEGPPAFGEFLVGAVLAQITEKLRAARSVVDGEGGQGDDEGGPTPEHRASLVGTQLAGLLMARYVLRLPSIVDADPEVLVDQVGPTLQRYLTGPC